MQLKVYACVAGKRPRKPPVLFILLLFAAFTSADTFAKGTMVYQDSVPARIIGHVTDAE